jgi:hypothetical protein
MTARFMLWFMYKHCVLYTLADLYKQGVKYKLHLNKTKTSHTLALKMCMKFGNRIQNNSGHTSWSIAMWSYCATKKSTATELQNNAHVCTKKVHLTNEYITDK